MPDKPMAWDDDPPREDGKWYPIYRAKPRVTLTLVAVSNHITGVWVHSVAKKDLPCIGKENGCEWCQAKRSRRWKGYLGAWEPHFSRCCLLEVTIDGLRHCNVELGRGGPNLRGRYLVATRLGTAENAPMRIEVKQAHVPAEDLPAEFDVRAALIRLWGELGN